MICIGSAAIRDVKVCCTVKSNETLLHVPLTNAGLQNAEKSALVLMQSMVFLSATIRFFVNYDQHSLLQPFSVSEVTYICMLFCQLHLKHLKHQWIDYYFWICTSGFNWAQYS